MKSRTIQLLIAILVGGLALYLFSTQVENWDKVWASIMQAHWGYVGIAVVLQFVGMYIRALRWKSFLGEPAVPSGKLFLFANIGFMGNGVFPARMGELIRPFLIGRYTPHTFSTGLATIVVERVFDLLGILLILAYVLMVFPFPTFEGAESTMIGGVEVPADPRAAIQGLAQLGLVTCIGLFIAVAIIVYFPDFSLRVARTLLKPFPHKIRDMLLRALVSFEQGATTFRRPFSFLYCFVLTMLLWVVIAFSEWVVLWAFGIDEVTFLGALFLMAGLCFAVMLPQLPGYIGIYQWATALILVQTFAIDPDVSAAVAWVMWVSQVPPIIVGGFICLLIAGVTFDEISHVSQEESEPVDGETQERSSPQST